ncbi:cytochrome c/c1 heme-lyase [Dipodascopsis tothii]|uniref:cytochrome c/c1 heme-lyase n=1 Tax=Dipodascopsis tothii TaxID=44089 RepID=UPI0034CDC5BF
MAECPVDHSGGGKAGGDKKNATDVCPVDHGKSAAGKTDVAGETCPVEHSPASKSMWAFPKVFTQKQDDTKVPPPSAVAEVDLLDKHRVVSSIPRANAGTEEASSHSGSGSLNGGETAAGMDGRAGNWVYPSEEMFFNAMKRKNWDPNAADMRVVVPIHNAVNERAWKEILQWEKTASAACGGPRLVSFKGDANDLSPRARINMFLGYSRPFDRHDWVVDRCGERVEYIIDFYAGRPNPSTPAVPSFYLDVRPKLSASGAWMRFKRFTGLE